MQFVSFYPNQLPIQLKKRFTALLIPRVMPIPFEFMSSVGKGARSLGVSAGAGVCAGGCSAAGGVVGAGVGAGGGVTAGGGVAGTVVFSTGVSVVELPPL
jgi:hypothetical protein